MELLQAINQHLARTGMSQTRFGRDAIGDGRLLPDLRRGRVPRAKTEARIRAFLTRGDGR